MGDRINRRSKINIGVKEVSEKRINFSIKPLPNMSISQMCTHNSMVFKFNQSIIDGMSWSGFGEFDAQLFQEPSNFEVELF